MIGKKPMANGLWILALGITCVMLFVGCAGVVAPDVTTPNPSPTSGQRLPTVLHVIRLSPPSNHVAPFEAQTDQAEKVQQLFATLRALPPFVPQVTCPADQGGGYLLSFRDSTGVVAQASIPAGGCLALDFSKPYGCHTFTEATMGQLADTLGVQHTALIRMAAFWNSATPGGPTAPAEPSEPLLPFSPCR
jgi:hypothetical protein